LGGDVLEVVSPFEPGTTAGRLLDKRGGDGGYMIIMQTEDAAKRRDYIVKNKLAKVIANMPTDSALMVQYHPKGIKGAIILNDDPEILYSLVANRRSYS
jgi:hypothetical protein